MNQNLRVNKTNFHMKGFALGLALIQRRNATQKLPIGRVWTKDHIFLYRLNRLLGLDSSLDSLRQEHYDISCVHTNTQEQRLSKGW